MNPLIEAILLSIVFLDGKKRNLINNIIFSILSGESEREVQNIFVPILPIPLNKAIGIQKSSIFSFNVLAEVKAYNKTFPDYSNW